MDSRFEALAGLPDAEVDLGLGALLVAAAAYPDLEVEVWLARLDDLGRRAAERMPQGADWTTQLSILNRLLFREEGFTGSEAEIFDPRDSFLNEVLTRKSGIPITLSLLFMEVGRRAGLELQGVSFPGHFLVKMSVPGGEVVIDPYNGGIPLTVEQLEARLADIYPEPPRPELEEVVVAAANKAILARLLRNLKTWYLHQSDWMRALSTLDYMLLLEPDSTPELRERGEVYWELECFRAAHADLERYLKLAPDAEEAAELHEKMVALQKLVARLN
jgi:regulator of sirC expression with transglutaminase-like and TPR domain